ncbi:MAG TPA: DoxX family protein, partial [Beijerinckiaceae bacterium]|nr:DoxX family protein [Beijerinckiaceae bacterium]
SLFLPSGLGKAMEFGRFAASLVGKGLPYPELWAFAVVAAELGGALALILGVWPRWAAAALIAFMAFTTWTTLRFSWPLPGWPLPGVARGQEAFYKNVAIIGGLLFYYVSGPGSWSWRRGGMA